MLLKQWKPKCEPNFNFLKTNSEYGPLSEKKVGERLPLLPFHLGGGGGMGIAADIFERGVEKEKRREKNLKRKKENWNLRYGTVKRIVTVAYQIDWPSFKLRSPKNSIKICPSPSSARQKNYSEKSWYKR